MSWIKTILTEATDLQIKRIHWTECTGTSKKGEFTMPYNILVSKLGEPEVHPEGSDVKVEWCFEASSDEDTFNVSVYNNPLYYDHVPPQDMDSWCIRCKTPYQGSIIKMFLLQK